jgi:uncharacterized protein
MKKLFVNEIPVLFHFAKDTFEPKPIIILSHWFTGSKEDWKERMQQLAELNYFVIALDNRFHGERTEGSFKEKIISPEGKLKLFQLREIMIDTAKDVTALLDHFISNYNIDKNRIGMIGISMGGYVTYAFLVKDNRIKAAIPFISSPAWDDIPKDTPIYEEDMEEFNMLTENFNPIKEYQKIYPRYLFMSVGNKDKHFDFEKLIRFHSDLEKYYGKESDKLKLKIYDAGHEVTDEMWNEAKEWLIKTL